MGMGLISRFPTPAATTSMEFYREIVKQEPLSSPPDPLAVDENVQPKWTEEEQADHSPQLMDLSTKKQQQVNNNYFFGAPLHQECYYEYPPPHPDFYHPSDFDEPLDSMEVDDGNDEVS